MKTLEDTDGSARVNISRNNDEALSFLSENIDDLPALILLDASAKSVGTQHTLVNIKTDTRFKHIPIVVFTDSKDQELEAYQQGASCCILKPESVKEIRDTIKALANFWFTVVRLPNV
ncbi:MAG: hypothetical protein R3182_02300 [Draconibacterium sp.]|nr:hypothetical protein [Draconibacterium sp.]